MSWANERDILTTPHRLCVAFSMSRQCMVETGGSHLLNGLLISRCVRVEKPTETLLGTVRMQQMCVFERTHSVWNRVWTKIQTFIHNHNSYEEFRRISLISGMVSIFYACKSCVYLSSLLILLITGFNKWIIDAINLISFNKLLCIYFQYSKICFFPRQNKFQCISIEMHE